MNKAKVLLIYPNQDTVPRIPTALAILSAKLIEKGFLKDPDILAASNSEDSVLDMPQFTKKQIEGKRRAFELYIKFPKKRWKEISIVENLTPEADKLWEELRQEFLEKYGADNDM